MDEKRLLADIERDALRQPAPLDPTPTGPQGLVDCIRVAFAFTESDLPTYIMPNVLFGTLGALAGSSLIEGRVPSVLEVAARLPLVLFWNWYMVLLFDMANQRTPTSVEEDRLNKPWRPLPSGKITCEQTRLAMLAGIPIALALNYALGVWKEGVFIFVMTWMYNDLGGGDELTRDAIIAVATALFNHASLRLAIGPDATVGMRGYIWIVLVSAMLLTTIMVQDLKDQVGDRTRNRRNVVLLCGETFARWFITAWIAVWSVGFSFFWQLHLWGYAPATAMGAYVAWRVLQKREARQDARTWKLWAVWTMILAFLPLLHRLQGIMDGYAFSIPF